MAVFKPVALPFWAYQATTLGMLGVGIGFGTVSGIPHGLGTGLGLIGALTSTVAVTSASSSTT